MVKNPKGGGQGKGGSPKLTRQAKTGRFVVEKSSSGNHRNAATVKEYSPSRAMPPDPRPPKDKK